MKPLNRKPRVPLTLAIILGLSLLPPPRSSAQVYNILYSFTGGADGWNPLYVKLLRDAKGNLVGTVEVGGAYGLGTVFRMDLRGNVTVLYSFSGGSTELLVEH